MKKGLNYNYEKLNNDSFFGRSYFMRKGRKVHDNSPAMNDVYWYAFNIGNYKDKSINMDNIRFVNYNDLWNNIIKPFKKGY